MGNFFDSFADKLDIAIVGIVLCSGFFQKMYLKGFSLSKDSGYDSALKTLLVSAVASALYIVFLKDAANANNWAKYFISYFGATSLYELLISPFTNWVKSKFGSIEK